MPERNAFILSEADRQSYSIIGRHFQRTLTASGIPAAERPLPAGPRERLRAAREMAGAVVFHNTIGPLFEPLPGALNVALPFHEWSRYPGEWVRRLNRFDAVWTTTRFVRQVLIESGVEVPIDIVTPALDLECPAPKRSRQASRPFRFLTCGAAHFRKGFHLLIAGFLEAFPGEGDATLTIKTSPECRWVSPRRDIVIDTRALSRAEMLRLYRHYDAYASTSLGEGLGLPVAEAILAGLPVVANRWGGHADLLTAGGCFEVPYKVIDQPFASDPSYYAPGQRCAFSAPSVIAAALRRAARSSAAARQQMARTARAHLLGRYGRIESVARLRRAWRRL